MTNRWLYPSPDSSHRLGLGYSEFYLLHTLNFGGQNFEFTIFSGLVLFKLFLGYANLGGYFLGGMSFLTGICLGESFQIRHLMYLIIKCSIVYC